MAVLIWFNADIEVGRQRLLRKVLVARPAGVIPSILQQGQDRKPIARRIARIMTCTTGRLQPHFGQELINSLAFAPGPPSLGGASTNSFCPGQIDAILDVMWVFAGTKSHCSWRSVAIQAPQLGDQEVLVSFADGVEAAGLVLAPGTGFVRVISSNHFINSTTTAILQHVPIFHIFHGFHQHAPAVWVQLLFPPIRRQAGGTGQHIGCSPTSVQVIVVER